MCEVKLTDLKEGDYVYRTISDWGTTTITKYPIEKITATGNIRLQFGYYDSQGYAKGQSSGYIAPLTVEAYRGILRDDLIKQITYIFNADKGNILKLIDSKLFTDFIAILKIVGHDNYASKCILKIAETLDSIKDLDDNYVFTKEDFR